MYPGLSKEQVQYVADSVREFEANYATVRL
jgi:hypothetical protein